MVRLEGSIKELKGEMEPIQTLPDVLKSLQRIEALLERLVMIQEAEAGVGAVKPPPASGRAAPRKRAASA